jgi:cell division septum initiation protein DivIVA
MVPQLQQQIETHKATIDSLTQELQQKNDLLTTMKTQIDAMLITSSAGTATATNTATTNSTTLANPG